MGLVWLWLWLFWCKKWQQKHAGISYTLLIKGLLMVFCWSRLPNQPSDHGNNCLMSTALWNVPEETQTWFCKIPGMFWRCLCRNPEAATRGKQPLLSRSWCSAKRHSSLLDCSGIAKQSFICLEGWNWWTLKTPGDSGIQVLSEGATGFALEWKSKWRMARGGKRKGKDGTWSLVTSARKVLQHLPNFQHPHRPTEFKPTIYNLVAIPNFKCCNESEPCLQFHILWCLIFKHFVLITSFQSFLC